MAPGAGLCQKKTKVEQVRLLKKLVTTVAVIVAVIAALVSAQFALIELGKEVVVVHEPTPSGPFIARGSGSWMMEGYPGSIPATQTRSGGFSIWTRTRSSKSNAAAKPVATARKLIPPQTQKCTG